LLAGIMVCEKCTVNELQHCSAVVDLGIMWSHHTGMMLDSFVAQSAAYVIFDVLPPVQWGALDAKVCQCRGVDFAPHVQ
jgi:hypothetical protein